MREIEEIIAKAQQEIDIPLPETTHRLVGAFLYWGEGSKTSGFEITNSGPFLIRFMVDWFERVFRVSRKTLKARPNIYPQQNENEIKQFWSLVTGVPLTNFGKTFVKPPNKGYKKNNLYYGTIKVEVPRPVNLPK